MPSISFNSDTASSTPIPLPPPATSSARVAVPPIVPPTPARTPGGPPTAGRGVVLLQATYQSGFSAVLATTSGPVREMSWIQGFPADDTPFLPPGGSVTVGGRRLGDTDCQTHCPEPSACTPVRAPGDRRLSAERAALPPGSSSRQLAMVGALC